MINHVFTCFYGYGAPTASGIYVPLTADLRVSDVLRHGLSKIRGSTPVEAERFAIQALKVLDGSSYATVLTAKDARLTYRMDEIGVDQVDSSEFIGGVLNLPGAVVSLATPHQDTSTTFSTSRISMERAASVLVGVLREIERLNGY
jgi:hypothetical protein